MGSCYCQNCSCHLEKNRVRKLHAMPLIPFPWIGKGLAQSQPHYSRIIFKPMSCMRRMNRILLKERVIAPHACRPVLELGESSPWVAWEEMVWGCSVMLFGFMLFFFPLLIWPFLVWWWVSSFLWGYSSCFHCCLLPKSRQCGLD